MYDLSDTYCFFPGNKKVSNGLKKIGAVIEKEEKSEADVVTVCLVDPGQYRAIDELVKDGRGAMDVVDLMEVKDTSQENT